MDFTFSPRVEQLRDRITGFLDEHLYPVEAEQGSCQGVGIIGVVREDLPADRLRLE